MQAYDERRRCRARQAALATLVVGASDKSDGEIEIVLTKNPAYAIVAGNPAQDSRQTGFPHA
ncbi:MULTISPECIES: hypothetical protein [unclassified Mesorhizobium]|uniref:hypothetical protein n=1 Tax=unclassified Mesorhizobium TaxID=325217 RepID=UPI003337C94B